MQGCSRLTCPHCMPVLSQAQHRRPSRNSQHSSHVSVGSGAVSDGSGLYSRSHRSRTHVSRNSNAGSGGPLGRTHTRSSDSSQRRRSGEAALARAEAAAQARADTAAGDARRRGDSFAAGEGRGEGSAHRHRHSSGDGRRRLLATCSAPDFGKAGITLSCTDAGSGDGQRASGRGVESSGPPVCSTPAVARAIEAASTAAATVAAAGTYAQRTSRSGGARKSGVSQRSGPGEGSRGMPALPDLCHSSASSLVRSCVSMLCRYLTMLFRVLLLIGC